MHPAQWKPGAKLQVCGQMPEHALLGQVLAAIDPLRLCSCCLCHPASAHHHTCMGSCILTAQQSSSDGNMSNKFSMPSSLQLTWDIAPWGKYKHAEQPSLPQSCNTQRSCQERLCQPLQGASAPVALSPCLILCKMAQPGAHLPWPLQMHCIPLAHNSVGRPA